VNDPSPPDGARRHVAVIGAGAAGLTAALRAAEAGARVTLLNAHPKVGLKILMSGGTRCNVTHREVSERDYHGGSRPFAARVLRAFTVPQTLAWFDTLGVALKLEETGKYFPVTDDAQTVLDALLGAVARAGVELRAGARVVRLEAGAGGAAGFRLGIQRVADVTAFAEVQPQGKRTWVPPAAGPSEWLEADRVIVATGGLSFPRTGSDGAGYGMLEALGHTIEPTWPALTPLAAEDPLCASAQGVTVAVALSLRVAGREVARCEGAMLFAHFGYSGPAALDLSRHWLSAEDVGAREVFADFFPHVPGEGAAAMLREAATGEPKVTMRRLLARTLPERLAETLPAEVGVDPSAALGQIPKGDRDRLATRLRARPMPVLGTLGYEKAEVTAGGVRLSEVNPSTLESRVVPGLFLCGEVLDVEGRLGGFNFQWAWSSGTVAGKSAGR